MKRFSHPGFVLLTFVLLIGCAPSPQTIALKPLVDAPSPAIGRGRSLALEVIDRRPSKHFGSRGGVYDETALIHPRSEVAATVRSALAERLSAGGFVVSPPDPAAPLALRVEVLSIDYVAGGEPVINLVRTRAAISAQVNNRGQTLTSQYQASTARRVVGPPGPATNEAIINEVVAQVLRRLLQDPAVLELLGR